MRRILTAMTMAILGCGGAAGLSPDDLPACSITPPPGVLQSIADLQLDRADGGCEWTLTLVDGGVLRVAN
jgi:hypothetical protein